MSELKELQYAFTEHLRNPDVVPVPSGLDPRRVGIYSELIFNNLSSLLSDFFPVIRSLMADDQWHKLVRDFFISHQAETPYFPQVSEEFVHYLSGRQHSRDDPPFLLELAHYEWMELYVYMHAADLPTRPLPEAELAATPLVLSELAEPLVYQYPVHRIRPDFQPTVEQAELTYLLVMRGQDELAHFYELQPFTFQFLQTVQESPGLIASDWLTQTASSLPEGDRALFVEKGVEMVKQFNRQCIFVSAGDNDVTEKEDSK